jgi:MinD-like ATPase involved in chromosome partitioning or flagellar assembly
MSSIVTFYSYKGGVGRSMALANVSILLARQGLRVLVVDWDLEAPGLERYFSYFPVDIKGDGILRLLVNAANEQLVEYKNFLWTVDVKASYPIAFLPSGKDQNPNYSAELGSFDWDGFFKEKKGGQFLENLRRQWLDDFDIVLIDSRTGLTDSGGICTILLPDIVVALFTANYQSLYGVRDVMRLAQQARQKLAYDRMPLTILPVPSRFGTRAEFKVSQEWLDLFQEALKEFFIDWLPTGIEPKQVFQQIKIPQVDYFGFGEKLAVIEQGISDPEGMGFIFNKIANFLASDFSDVHILLGETSPELLLDKGKLDFVSSSREDYLYDVYISYGQSQLLFDFMRTLVKDLSAEMELEFENFRAFFDATELSGGDIFEDKLSDTLRKSRILLSIVTPTYFSNRFSQREWKTFLIREEITNSNLIIPIIFRGTRDIPDELEDHKVFNFESVSTEGKSREKSKEYTIAIRKLAERLRDLLEEAPPFDPHWPIAYDDKTMVYVVKSGDTLPAIALRFGVSKNALIELNNIRDPNLIHTGQTLKIPQ